MGEEAVELEVEPFLYSTSLVFSFLDQTLGDTGEYTCTVTVTPTGSPFNSPVIVMATKLVHVQSKCITICSHSRLTGSYFNYSTSVSAEALWDRRL